MFETITQGSTMVGSKTISQHHTQTISKFERKRFTVVPLAWYLYKKKVSTSSSTNGCTVCRKSHYLEDQPTWESWFVKYGGYFRHMYIDQPYLGLLTNPGYEPLGLPIEMIILISNSPPLKESPTKFLWLEIEWFSFFSKTMVMNWKKSTPFT